VGRGARPPKAHSLPLKTSAQPAPTPTVSAPSPTANAGSPALAVVEAEPVPPTPPPTPAPPQPVASDLATLQAVKEELRQQHPEWYPDFRDSFGNQLTEKLLPSELAQLSAAELGLPAGVVSADPDRLRRELRALAFARSYLMAQAGDAEGLSQVSDELAHFWNERLEGKLIPLSPIDHSNPVPWVHELNQLHSRHTTGLDSKYGKQARYRHFVHAVKDWTDGRWRALRAASKKVLNGQHGGADHAKARELIEGIDSAPNNAPRLWRKEKASDVAARLGTSSRQLFDHLRGKVGQELTQDIVSTAAGSGIWAGDFVWEIEPGAQAIHAYPISWHPSEKEWITAGRFQVLKVDPISAAGGVRVLVRQTGVFYD
jgi:hypothetical protein